MTGSWPRRRVCGAIIGLVALYAVLLQAFLTNVVPAAYLGQAGLLCAAHDPGTPADGPPDHTDHACCTLAHAATVAPPVLGEGVVLLPPARIATVVWRPEAPIPRTGPPTHAHGARGPPLA